jgi:hypothetical protein
MFPPDSAGEGADVVFARASAGWLSEFCYALFFTPKRVFTEKAARVTQKMFINPSMTKTRLNRMFLDLRNARSLKPDSGFKKE